MKSKLYRKLAILFVSTLALIASSTANAITIDPGMASLYFSNNSDVKNSGGYSPNSFYVLFGNEYHNNPTFISYNLNFNPSTGTASVFIQGLEGKVYGGANQNDYRGDASPLGSVKMDVAFTWTNIVQEASGNFVSRDPSGNGGAVASLTSDYFNGTIQFALSSKSTGMNDWSKYVWGDNASTPFNFFLGQAPANYYHSFFGDYVFNAWVMANGPVNVKGQGYTVTGDFSGSAGGSSEVPEPATMLLLGSGVLGATLRRRSAVRS